MRADHTDPRALTRALIAEIIEADPGTLRGPERLREDLGMDSLGSMELLSSVSVELKLDIEAEEAMGIVTVDDACAFVERCVAEGRSRVRAPTA